MILVDWSVLTLILVSPSLVGGEILSVGQGDVDGVKRSQEILGAEQGSKDIDDGGLGSYAPGKVLVRRAIGLNQTLLMNDGQALLPDGRRVVSVVSQVERLEPFVDLVNVFVASLDGENTLDDGVSISVEVVTKVAVVGVGVEAVEDGRAANRRGGFVNLGL